MTHARKVSVVVNPAAGPSPRPSSEIDDLIRQFRAAGLEPQLSCVNGLGLAPALASAAAAPTDLVVAAGGDGTASAAAAILAGGDKPLAIVPLGTRNHFARDLGIGLDPAAAIHTIREGYVRHVDVARVNGRRFINNSSVGWYPAIVEQRERQRRRGYGKRMASLLAAARQLGEFPMLRARFETAAGAFEGITPFVFVGNNRYELSGLSLRRRPLLDSGELWLWVANRARRRDVLHLLVRALLGGLERDRHLASMSVRALDVYTRRRRVRVALDGEIATMSSPLRYAIEPGALPVIGAALER